MGYLENLERDRRTKLDRVRSLGMNPYGQLSGWDHVLSIEQARDFHIGVKGVREATIPERDAWVFAGREEQLKDCVLRGRVTAKNNRGKLKFFFIQDMTGEIQVMFSKDKFTEPGWEFVSQIDVFDHIEVRGSVIETQTGEITIAATDFVFQGKSISPPPEKYHGVKDEEILVRQRYLALIQDKPLRDRLVLRSSVTRSIRMSLERHDYIEVETPVLSMHANGASARPFTTHHNSLDQTFHLRIAPELDLKRLLVGGLERVYEIGRVFRNEGVDATHNPEFTILECYEAYADASRMMVLCEDIVKRCATEVAKTLGNIDAMLLEPLLTPFRRVTMEKMFSLVGVDLFDEAAVMQAGADRKIHAADYAGMVDKMADHLLPSCNGGSPLFLTGYPAAMCPLARRKDDRTADRFELFVFTPSGPMEVANGYSELNDPDEQLKNFEEQAHHKMIEDLQQEELEGGLGELSEPLLDSVSDHYKNTLLQRHIDHDYVNALKIGLPMAGGLGIGVDRLMMVLTGSETIRNVIAFPLVKRKAE